MAVAADRPGQASTYLDYLPGVFREGADAGQPGFLGRFLLAFEHLLTGVGDPEEPGLDELLDRVADHFDPERAPPEFVDWLAGWVALTLRADLEVAEGGEGGEPRDGRERARALVRRAVPLYRTQGTRRGLEELLRLFTGGLSPSVTELTASMQVGVSSRIGVDTLLDGGAPHFFHVVLRLPQPTPGVRQRLEKLARAILDIEKPAHTRYRLSVLTPAMQIGVSSQVGVDTLLAPAGTYGDLPWNTSPPSA